MTNVGAEKVGTCPRVPEPAELESDFGMGPEVMMPSSSHPEEGRAPGEDGLRWLKWYFLSLFLFWPCLAMLRAYAWLCA